MGIPDEESWFKTQLLPTGAARGWRRTVLVAGLVAALVLVVAAALVGLFTASSEDTSDQVVRVYGDAMGASADELDTIRQEALDFAAEVCSTSPGDFAEMFSNTSIGSDAAIEIAELRCPDKARDFAEDEFRP